MQAEIGFQDRERSTSRNDDGLASGCPASEVLAQQHGHKSSVRSSTEAPLPACSAANESLAAYCSSLLRTCVDIKLSEPPGASKRGIVAVATHSRLMPSHCSSSGSSARLMTGRPMFCYCSTCMCGLCVPLLMYMAAQHPACLLLCSCGLRHVCLIRVPCTALQPLVLKAGLANGRVSAVRLQWLYLLRSRLQAFHSSNWRSKQI
jgi:hypothetical protein